MVTHYIIFYEYVYDPVTWDEAFSLVKAVSPGNNYKNATIQEIQPSDTGNFFFYSLENTYVLN